MRTVLIGHRKLKRLNKNKYINKENIFITGPGGTGKTYLIRRIVDHAKINKRQFRVCALTGCAAILLMCGAVTLHRFAGVGLATGTIDSVVNRVIKNGLRRVNWNIIDVLIVDEVSMLSLKVFRILDLIGRKIKKRPDLPFGGIQIIFSGDFYQLPPVGNVDDPESQKFCFESNLWQECFPSQNHIILKTIYRQTESKYIKILNNIRIGRITQSMINTLLECVDKKLENEKGEKIKPTIILPRRRDVDQINKSELNKLTEPEHIYLSLQVPQEDLPLTKREKENFEIITEREKTMEYEYLRENIMAEKEIILKKGALVMCVANIDLEGEYPIVNGSQGIIIDIINNYPLVKFNNGNTRTMMPHIWKSERLSCIAISQIPLIHAWAITIHKAQGLSIERGLINIGDNIFECGQTYVALSRIRSLGGLYLTSFDYTKIKINKKVQHFYSQI
jgi:ATP-dependent DNA helicase PIF1